MSQLERIYTIQKLIVRGDAPSALKLQEVLEVSRATLKRDLEYMRDRLHIPIQFSREKGGYRLATSSASASDNSVQELPGLWFSSGEVQALLTMEQLLAKLGPGGFLTPHIQPLMQRISSMLSGADSETAQLRRRVRILGLAQRTLQPEHFQTVGIALVQRKRLQISYRARSNQKLTEREVSPLRLIHYRENWHLDAWCHLRKALRNFSVDRIDKATIVASIAKEISEQKLDATFNPSYGIFAGGRVQWARLRFSSAQSEWVKDQQWHPQQEGTFRSDGSYVLQMPFSDHRELMMDILKFGAHCEVLAPTGLRKLVAEEIQKMSQNYFSR